jgi:Arm DNA-binding domain
MPIKISILFYTKRAKATTDGLIPIYSRVIIEGQYIEISTRRYVEAAKWSVEQLNSAEASLSLTLLLWQSENRTLRLKA